MRVIAFLTLVASALELSVSSTEGRAESKTAFNIRARSFFPCGTQIAICKKKGAFWGTDFYLQICSTFLKHFDTIILVKMFEILRNCRSTLEVRTALLCQTH